MENSTSQIIKMEREATGLWKESDSRFFAGIMIFFLGLWLGLGVAYLIMK
jgi:hypothetical protein